MAQLPEQVLAAKHCVWFFQDIQGWAENDRGVSFIFGPDVVSNFLQKQVPRTLAVRKAPLPAPKNAEPFRFALPGHAAASDRKIRMPC